MHVLVIMGVLLSSAVALAAGETEVIFRRHTVVVFDDDTVDGRLDKADVAYVHARGNTRHESLIQPRESFRAEVLRSLR